MKEGKVLVPRTSDVSDMTGITKLNLMHERGAVARRRVIHSFSKRRGRRRENILRRHPVCYQDVISSVRSPGRALLTASRFPPSENRGLVRMRPLLQTRTYYLRKYYSLE